METSDTHTQILTIIGSEIKNKIFILALMQSEVILKQKSGFDYKELILENDGIKVKAKKNKDKWEFLVKYEEIGFDLIKKTEDNGQIPLIIIGSFGVLVFAALGIQSPPKDFKSIIAYLCLFSLVFWLIWYGIKQGKKKYIYLAGGTKQLELFENNPDEIVIGNFINTIHSRIRKTQKNKYLKNRTDPQMSLDMNIQWLEYLVEINAITAEEKQRLFNEARTLKANPIGFIKPNLE